MNETMPWKLNRLKTMGPIEVCWRIRQAVVTWFEHQGIGLARDMNASTGSVGPAWVRPLPTEFHDELYVKAADRILAGRWDVFSLRDRYLGCPPRWNRDPKTGVEAPLEFGKTINYRDERVVGDVKYMWEPNRHLELVTMAQAFHLTGEARFAKGARVLQDSWFEQCPYPLGPNWTSSLELALRLVNWAVAWHLLGGNESILFAGVEGDAFRRRWLDSIYQHCHFISGHFSLHSSANNHLLGEYMGLFIGSVVWPGWKESAGWRELAKTGFENEVLKQNAVDGTNREQAIWYHHEVTDMTLLCGLFGAANGIEFSRDFWARLEGMLEFIASVMDVRGYTPMIGDSDDAVMVRFVPGPFDVYRSLLATGAVLLKRGDFKAKAGRFDDKSRWLLGDAAEAQFDALEANTAHLPVRRAFPEGGYWIIGERFETQDEIRVIADAGPLGYLSIAAHGHADALAFTMSVGGEQILIDPGTYAYHTQEKWRNYFRSTAAHNTVRIDKQDQSVMGGKFLWLKHAAAHCLCFETSPHKDVWVAEHDGYRRLKDPVIHQREIVLHKPTRTLRVTDRLMAKATHRAEWHWHFAETCRIDLEDGVARILSGPVRLHLTMPRASIKPQLVTGRDEPPLGWISRRFDEKAPCPSLVWASDISGNAEFVTEFSIEVTV